MRSHLPLFNSAQKKAIYDECQKDFFSMLDEYNKEVVAQVVYILHFSLGFGKKRIKEFLDELVRMQQEQKEHYMLDDKYVYILCKEQLRKDGIDLDELMAA